MKEVRFFYVPDAAHQEELPPDEAMHAMRVLRLKGGDEMMLMDGVGNYYRAEVTIAAIIVTIRLRNACPNSHSGRDIFIWVLRLRRPWTASSG